MEHASATIKEWATVITEMDEMEDAVQELRPTNSKTESDSSLDQASSDPDEPSDNFCVVQTTRKGSIFVPGTPFARLVSTDPEYYRRLSNP
ncbi:hypothetical protein BV898_09153 [Hypsibius exemplaris]|uniref:Uncharacterized protein n=1 Tax=Hypsibius exemplaris TaxID=2072580 RepID=A0A1W0WNR4_HYPEX|nr:hypothetical protein BV898_09153 [Hypsibius exemplaris]